MSAHCNQVFQIPYISTNYFMYSMFIFLILLLSLKFSEPHFVRFEELNLRAKNCSFLLEGQKILNSQLLKWGQNRSKKDK